MEPRFESGTTASRHSVLLVDDDTELCSLMLTFFSQHGFRVESAYNGSRGLARALEGGFDLILLNVMLPGLNGFEVLHQLRRRSAVPVIMLTARTEQADRITGLNTGADDYLPKPFGPEELLARIRAVLRRTSQPGRLRPEALDFGGIRLESATRQVWRGETRVELTSIDFEILDLLMLSAGRAVSRDELAAVLYQRELSPYERSTDVHVSHLRRKLEHGGGAVIRTVLAVKLATPLRVLGKAVEGFGQGNLSVRVNSRRRDEIGDLSRAFDNMGRSVTRLAADRLRVSPDRMVIEAPSCPCRSPAAGPTSSAGL